MKQCNVKSLVSMTWVYRLSIEPTVVQWYGISLLRCINRLWYQAATSNHGTCLMCPPLISLNETHLWLVHCHNLEESLGTIFFLLTILAQSSNPSAPRSIKVQNFFVWGRDGFFFMRETMSYLRFSSGSALCKIKLALPSPRWNSRPTITCKTGRFYIERCQVRTILTR